ncbi:metal ABC transporter substrate-binding protein [Clostridium polynesiense]|uniref:metal ABC transporter substrate-binding protein n=1 Tax=Clostridium polynesiense TaxID=1325933 RepID=UPI0005910B6A|nr:metal ABC transporter substrate-binding protein [Clostridium polynesiense]
MKRYILVIAMIFVIVLTASACSSNEINEPSAKAPAERDVVLNITTTNKLLYYMVKDIVGDKHYVDYMFKNEKEIWDFKYTEDSLNNIAKKDLFIYIGGNYEPWMVSFTDTIKKSKVGIINASRGVKLLNLSKSRNYNNREIKENPYYWMSIDNYKIALLNIKNAVQDKDPKNRQFYEQNFSNKIKSIEEKEVKLKKLSSTFKESYIGLHDDYTEYLIEYLGLKSIKLQDLFKNEEEIKKFDESMKDKKGKAIFFYVEDSNKEFYEPLIEKYSMKAIKVQGIVGSKEYSEMLSDLL